MFEIITNITIILKQLLTKQMLFTERLNVIDRTAKIKNLASSKFISKSIEHGVLNISHFQAWRLFKFQFIPHVQTLHTIVEYKFNYECYKILTTLNCHFLLGIWKVSKYQSLKSIGFVRGDIVLDRRILQIYRMSRKVSRSKWVQNAHYISNRYVKCLWGN